MLGVLIIAAFLGQPQDDPSVWQDYGRDAQGAAVLLNPDTVITGDSGPEAMLRVRHAKPLANGSTQQDIKAVFDCSTRNVRRALMGERFANGEIAARSDNGEPMPAIGAAAGTPLGKVLDTVCELAASAG
jgi:hypothetical protein